MPKSRWPPTRRAPGQIEQLALPGLESRALVIAPDEPAWAQLALETPPASLPALAEHDDQLDLFGDLTLLRHDLEGALERADFDAALALRARLAEEFGAAAARPYAVLDALAGLEQSAPGDALRAWDEVADDVDPPLLRERATRALITRLVARHGAAAVVAQAPSCLPAVVATLLAADDEPSAACLVRDALLAGRALEPLAFPAGALRELLAEDLAPRWLACLGAVRRLWPVPTPADADAALSHGDIDDDERARAFWECLGVARSAAADEAQRLAARRRLRRLHPALHAQAVQRATSSKE